VTLSFPIFAKQLQSQSPCNDYPKQTNLLKAADSPNYAIPTATVSTEPMPVHTAYAVPSGKLRVATPTRPRLSTIMMTVAIDGQNRVNPSEDFSPIDNPVSNTPATTRIDQAYCFIPKTPSLSHRFAIWADALYGFISSRSYFFPGWYSPGT
jgi:hypothetical protein